MKDRSRTEDEESQDEDSHNDFCQTPNHQMIVDEESQDEDSPHSINAFHNSPTNKLIKKQYLNDDEQCNLPQSSVLNAKPIKDEESKINDSPDLLDHARIVDELETDVKNPDHEEPAKKAGLSNEEPLDTNDAVESQGDPSTTSYEESKENDSPNPMKTEPIKEDSPR